MVSRRASAFARAADRSATATSRSAATASVKARDRPARWRAWTCAPSACAAPASVPIRAISASRSAASAAIRPRSTSGGAAGRRGRVEGDEPDRVDPALARPAVACVLGTRRSAFAGEPVVRVEPEEPAVAVHPWRLVADDDGRPRPLLARPDGDAVAARVVHEGDAADRRPAAAPAVRSLPQRLDPEAPERSGRRPDDGRQPERDREQVLAGLDVRGVRARPGEDDRVVAFALEVRVVPAAPKVGPDLVVRGAAEPDGDDLAVGLLLDEDEALLQVRLVVVGTREGGAPVVRRVEEHVVADGPSGLADDAPVVHEPRVRGADRRVLHLGRGHRPAGDLATDQEREVEAGVDEPRDDPDAREAARCGEPRPTLAPRPAGELRPSERLLHEAQVLPLPGRRARVRGEVVRRQLPERDEQLRVAVGRPRPQLACRDVGLRRHREEELTVGVAHDRLEPPQELEVARLLPGHAAPPATPSVTASAVRATIASTLLAPMPNAPRTSLWFR